MKKLLKALGITIALITVGAVTRAMYENNKIYEIEVGGLENIPDHIQQQFGLGKYSLKK